MHEGHRKRLCARLEDDETSIYDHEILEILLFNACPRVNTNPAAHALIERFGSLKEVLEASLDELKSVPGVGDQTARYLRVIGLCYKRMENSEDAAVLNCFADCKVFVSKRFRKKKEEFMEIYMMEKNGKVSGILSYTSSDRNMVSVSSDVLVAEIASAKPYGVIAAHNHLNGSSLPSSNDEAFTAQLQLICNMNNVQLLDHIVYASDEDIFSYNYSGRIERIRNEYSLTNIGKWITHSN